MAVTRGALKLLGFKKEQAVRNLVQWLAPRNDKCVMVQSPIGMERACNELTKLVASGKKIYFNGTPYASSFGRIRARSKLEPDDVQWRPIAEISNQTFNVGNVAGAFSINDEDTQDTAYITKSIENALFYATEEGAVNIIVVSEEEDANYIKKESYDQRGNGYLDQAIVKFGVPKTHIKFCIYSYLLTNPHLKLKDKLLRACGKVKSGIDYGSLLDRMQKQ